MHRSFRLLGRHIRSLSSNRGGRRPRGVMIGESTMNFERFYDKSRKPMTLLGALALPTYISYSDTCDPTSLTGATIIGGATIMGGCIGMIYPVFIVVGVFSVSGNYLGYLLNKYRYTNYHLCVKKTDVGVEK